MGGEDGKFVKILFTDFSRKICTLSLKKNQNISIKIIVFCKCNGIKLFRKSNSLLKNVVIFFKLISFSLAPKLRVFLVIFRKFSFHYSIQ